MGKIKKKKNKKKNKITREPFRATGEPDPARWIHEWEHWTAHYEKSALGERRAPGTQPGLSRPDGPLSDWSAGQSPGHASHSPRSELPSRTVELGPRSTAKSCDVTSPSRQGPHKARPPRVRRPRSTRHGARRPVPCHIAESPEPCFRPCGPSGRPAKVEPVDRWRFATLPTIHQLGGTPGSVSDSFGRC